MKHENFSADQIFDAVAPWQGKLIRWGLARRMNLSCGERGQACEGVGGKKDRVRAAETGKKKRRPRSRVGRARLGEKKQREVGGNGFFIPGKRRRARARAMPNAIVAIS
jgi:hypothetical protein